MAQTILPRPTTASYAQAPFTSSSLVTAGLASKAKAAHSSAELIESISETRVLHEKREQHFQQELQTIRQQQKVELAAIVSDLGNAQEMFKKLSLERDILVQRVRQLESHLPQKTSRPSALPYTASQIQPSSEACSFVQTVLGVYHIPFEAPQLQPHVQERTRPVRLSAVHREQRMGESKDDSSNEKDTRRSSKRQKPSAKGANATAGVAPVTAGVAPDDTSIPLVAKSGTRIRLKPIAAPKGAEDMDATADSINGDADADSVSGVQVGMKRPRSPTSSSQGPQRPPKKRNTNSTAARNKISIPAIPRGPDGAPLLPMQVGMFTLRSLGQIQSAEDLSTAKTLYPIGYKCERRWFSTIDPKALVTYTCSIEAGRDAQHPIFVVVPEDAPREQGHSATAAWWNIYKDGLRVRNQPEQAVMNGDEMFGLYDNVIKAMLQELPGADTVNPYIWRTFIEGGHGGKKRNAANAVYHIETSSRPGESWEETGDGREGQLPSAVTETSSFHSQANGAAFEESQSTAITPDASV